MDRSRHPSPQGYPMLHSGRRHVAFARAWILAAVLLPALLQAVSAHAQPASRRLLPSPSSIPGALGAVDEAQPMVQALPAWQVGALEPFVNLFSGNLFVRYHAVAAPAIGFDWDLSFYYNSTRASEIGALGKGWRHSYETTLLLNTPPGAITVAWGDGRRDVFTLSSGT